MAHRLNFILTGITFGIIMIAIPSVHGQSSTGINREEAVRLAEEQAESYNPPMDIKRMQHPQAVYLSNENAWIVEFAEHSSSAMADSDYMVRVESTSGKAPEILRASRKERYRPYFSSKL